MKMSERNNYETLEETYPEVKKMSFMNKGFDYIYVNDKNICIRIEHKYRSKNVKFDITPAQEELADIFALRTHTDRHYFMTKKQYLELSKPHSSLASGWRGKSREISQKDFIENSTTNLYDIVNSIDNKVINLENFM
tara:strand:- start:45 stop:455 length:411 start_codon:yes stop_codon:yes gene_type:complete